MSTARRVVLVVLAAVLCAVLAAMATSDQADLDSDADRVTTPSTTEPVIAHIEETN